MAIEALELGGHPHRLFSSSVDPGAVPVPGEDGHPRLFVELFVTPGGDGSGEGDVVEEGIRRGEDGGEELIRQLHKMRTGAKIGLQLQVQQGQRGLSGTG